MGKFKYSMQNILDIKIKLETQAKNEFSEANRAYLIEKEKLEELFKKRAVYEFSHTTRTPSLKAQVPLQS